MSRTTVEELWIMKKDIERIEEKIQEIRNIFLNIKFNSDLFLKIMKLEQREIKRDQEIANLNEHINISTKESIETNIIVKKTLDSWLEENGERIVKEYVRKFNPSLFMKMKFKENEERIEKLENKVKNEERLSRGRRDDLSNKILELEKKPCMKIDRILTNQEINCILSIPNLEHEISELKEKTHFDWINNLHDLIIKHGVEDIVKEISELQGNKHVQQRYINDLREALRELKKDIYDIAEWLEDFNQDIKGHPNQETSDVFRKILDRLREKDELP